jgi:hypothetical protein
MVNNPGRGKGKRVNHPALGQVRHPVFVTSDARAKFANSEIAGLIRNFGIGDIRSVSISTVWSDGEVGGSYHVEGDDKVNLIAQLERALRVLRGEETSRPLV